MKYITDPKTVETLNAMLFDCIARINKYRAEGDDRHVMSEIDRLYGALAIYNEVLITPLRVEVRPDEVLLLPYVR